MSTGGSESPLGSYDEQDHQESEESYYTAKSSLSFDLGNFDDDLEVEICVGGDDVNYSIRDLSAYCAMSSTPYRTQPCSRPSSSLIVKRDVATNTIEEQKPVSTCELDAELLVAECLVDYYRNIEEQMDCESTTDEEIDMIFKTGSDVTRRLARIVDKAVHIKMKELL